MAKITFEKHFQRQEFLNVLKGYKVESFEVEVRYDPLLGDTSVYNKLLKGKIKVLYGVSDQKLIEEMVKESQKGCIFCGDNIKTNTPKYPDELIESGRIQIGESILFPNLFPIGKYHSVISISKSHFLKLKEFQPKLLADAFFSAQDFVKSIYKCDSSSLYVTLNCNYLFPSGSSLVHPHLQLLITSTPYSYHKRLSDACLNYFLQNNSNYFNDLIIEEKKIGERYISQNGKWHCIATYAPTGSNEVIAVHETESDISGLSESDIHNIANAISNVLAYYEKMGFLSFNFTLFSNRNLEGFNCLLKIITRQNLYPNYRNDDYYLQKILQSELIILLPEELASNMKQSLQN